MFLYIYKIQKNFIKVVLFNNVLYRVYILVLSLFIYAKGKAKTKIIMYRTVLCYINIFSVLSNSRKDTERHSSKKHNLTIIICIEILYNKRNAFVYIFKTPLSLSVLRVFSVPSPRGNGNFNFSFFCLYFHRLVLLEFRVNY